MSGLIVALGIFTIAIILQIGEVVRYLKEITFNLVDIAEQLKQINDRENHK